MAAGHVSYITRLLNNIDFMARQMAGRSAGVRRLRPPRCTASSSPPIEIYPPKTSPSQEWIIRFILSFRNFHLERFECDR